MTEELPIQRVEVRFVGTPPVQRVARASGVSELEIDGPILRCVVSGSFQPFLEALHGYEVLRLQATPTHGLRVEEHTQKERLELLGPLEMVAIFFVFGCPTWLLSKLIDRAFGGEQKQGLAEAKAAQNRARALESQLLDSRRQNDQLEKQLEWHTKMLETPSSLTQRVSDDGVAGTLLRAGMRRTEGTE